MRSVTTDGDVRREVAERRGRGWFWDHLWLITALTFSSFIVFLVIAKRRRMPACGVIG
jgi:hypothetical protein